VTVDRRARAPAGRYEEPVIAVATLAVTVVPLLVERDVRGLGEWVGATCTIVGAVVLALWRRAPGPVVGVSCALLFVTAQVLSPDTTKAFVYFQF